MIEEAVPENRFPSLCLVVRFGVSLRPFHSKNNRAFNNNGPRCNETKVAMLLGRALRINEIVRFFSSSWNRAKNNCSSDIRPFRLGNKSRARAPRYTCIADIYPFNFLSPDETFSHAELLFSGDYL